MISLKSLVSIRTIMVIRLLSGLYYNISTNTLITLAARLYCALCLVAVVYYFVTVALRLTLKGIILLASFIIQYVTNTIVNMVTNGEHILKFLAALKEIDFLLGSRPEDDIAISRIVFIGMLINTLFGTVLPCIVYFSQYNCLSLSLEPTLGFMVDLNVDLSYFTRIIMFELLWSRTALLRKRLEKDLSIASRFESDEKRREQNLKKCMSIYNKLVKTHLQCDGPMKFMTFFSTINIFPKVLVVVYNFITRDKSWFAIINTVQLIVQSFLPLIPAFFAELVYNETDKIKLCVIKQLLVSKDTKSREAVEDAVRFFEQRRFRYTIWRLYTLDVTLIFTVFGMITTYTVAMIQFAHFYD